MNKNNMVSRLFRNDLLKISYEIDHISREQVSSGVLRFLAGEEFNNLWQRENISIDEILDDLLKGINGKSRGGFDEIKRRFQQSLGGQGFNLIPSDLEGSCYPFLLAISRGNFGEGMNTTTGKIGFKGLMLNVFASWFRCIGQNRETLILTADWNQKQFDQFYKPVVESYCRTHNKKAYFVVVGDSRSYLAYSI
jgi:hypothetical protein